MNKRRPPPELLDEADEDTEEAETPGLLDRLSGSLRVVVFFLFGTLTGWGLGAILGDSGEGSGNGGVIPTDDGLRLPHYYAPEAFQRLIVNPAGTNAQRYILTSVELGLKSYDRTAKPPKDDITDKLAQDAVVMETLGRYVGKMRSIMSESLSRRRIGEFDRRELIPIQQEIRDRINQEVLRPAFPPATKRQIVVVEVLFTEMVIQ